MSQQCTSVATKANHLLGCIYGRITSRFRSVIIPFYSATVRTRLEYCAKFWFPQFKKGMDRPERVQMSHEDDLWAGQLLLDGKSQGSQVFSSWSRFKADAITIFHCLKRCYKEDGGSLFIRRYMEKTRGSGYKLHWERFCPVIEMFYSENYQFGTASSWA